MTGRKRSIILYLTALTVFLCTGCGSSRSREYTEEELGGFVKIEVYSAGDGELLNTVEDEESIYQFNHISVGDYGSEEHQEELKEKQQEEEARYLFAAYKSPAAKIGGKEPEKVFTLTVYENSNIVKMQVSEGSIKNMSLPEEFLTFYYEIPEEDLEFYYSMAGS